MTRSSGIIFLLIAAISGGVAPANAGDFSLPDVIGYSKDFRYFAFEEFGIADASGFPYSNMFIIDLELGSPAPEAAVRVFLESEADPSPPQLVQARRMALDEAQPQLDRLGIGWPAEMLAYNADGVPDATRLSLRFGTTGYSGAVVGDYLLELQMLPIDTVLECEQWIESKPQGLLLKISDYAGSEKEIYRNTKASGYRNCPLRYELAGVFAPFEARDISDAVALISVFSPGYEGPDRRFIAVPIGRAVGQDD